MKRFIVKTNFGYTYEWLPERIAKDYADITIQFEDNLKTWDELYNDIVTDEEWLDQWFCDYIRDDVMYAFECAKVIEVNQVKAQEFRILAIAKLGCVE